MKLTHAAPKTTLQRRATPKQLAPVATQPRPAASSAMAQTKDWAPKTAATARPAGPRSAPEQLLGALRNKDLRVSKPAVRALAADQSSQAVALIRSILRSPEKKKLSEQFSLFGADSRETATVKRQSLAALEGRTDRASAAVLTEVIELGHGKFLGAKEGASSQWRTELRDFPKLAMKMLGERRDPAARAIMHKEAVGGGATWGGRVRAELYDAYFAQVSGPLDQAVVRGAMKSEEGLRSLARYLPGKGQADLEAEVTRRLARI